MKSLHEVTNTIIEELQRTLSGINQEKTDELIDQILDAGSIFVAGAGRSGLAMKGFAMRLMHMGLSSYVIGETVTPSFTQNDLLIIGSGSGTTSSLEVAAKKASNIGGKLTLITINPQSEIARAADTVVTIPAPSPKIAHTTDFTSIQPMGSLFEQSLWLLLDALILLLMERKDLRSEDMFERHANLE